MGSPRENCETGIKNLEKWPSYPVKVTARSRFYKTEPIDYENQDWFVNAVVRIQTRLAPLELLDLLKQIEVKAGRTISSTRFGPRVLDLDILLYDELVHKSSSLTIPHSRMHKRRFVLAPFCDIDSQVVHPVLGMKIGRILETLDHTGQRIIPL
jgi:2-amino-4-hydroxy-6-hydroxymethyldihydropteridine diphosphokinase